MWVAYWAVAGSLAALFLAAGLSKLIRPKEALAATNGMGYVDDFTAGQIKLIGFAEVIGAIGLVLPMLVSILPLLSPIAGLALAVLMAGAVATHARRSEAFVVPLVLAVLSLAVTALGFLVLA